MIYLIGLSIFIFYNQLVFVCDEDFIRLYRKYLQKPDGGGLF
jgi:hypothetical protein